MVLISKIIILLRSAILKFEMASSCLVIKVSQQIFIRESHLKKFSYIFIYYFLCPKVLGLFLSYKCMLNLKKITSKNNFEDFFKLNSESGVSPPASKYLLKF